MSRECRFKALCLLQRFRGEGFDADFRAILVLVAERFSIEFILGGCTRV